MLKEINFPNDLSYATDGSRQPIEFYLRCLKNSISFDLKLGYFSSNAIRVLSVGFAQFIYNGGKVRIITNHYLSEKDKYLLNNSVREETVDYSYINSVINNDVQELEKILSSGEQHFFNCLKYLLNEERLILKPVKIKPGKLSHYKQGIFGDGKNHVYFIGSCNFTYNGLVENGESLEVKRSWGSTEEQLRIKNESKKLENIFNESDDGYEYLSLEQIETVINRKGLSKDLKELVIEEEEILHSLQEVDPPLNKILSKEKKEFKNWIKNDLGLPIFPHEKPFDYQVEAYKAWTDNNKRAFLRWSPARAKQLLL